MLAITAVLALPATAATVSSIRVRLHPYMAAAGTLPPEAKAKLEALVGTGLTLTGTTRTGALDLALAVPQDSAAIATALRRCAMTAASCGRKRHASRRVARQGGAGTPPYATAPGQQLMVRLKDGTVPDWPTLLSRLGSRIGTNLAVERQIGNVWVMRVDSPQSPSRLAQMADALQQDGAVQYADPVRRAMPFAAPNDPYYSQQWSLHDALSGVNAEAAWALQPDLVEHRRRGHRHRHPAASRPGGTRAPRIRLHLATRTARATATAATRIRATKATGAAANAARPKTASSMASSFRGKSPRTPTTA